MVAQRTQLLMAEGSGARIEGLVREAPIVPETTPLDDLLADLQRNRSSLAIVIDIALVGLERALTPWQRARAAVG